MIHTPPWLFRATTDALILSHSQNHIKQQQRCQTNAIIAEDFEIPLLNIGHELLNDHIGNEKGQYKAKGNP